MFLYRDHRSSLEESMKTLQEFPDRAALAAYLRNDLGCYGVEFEDGEIKIEPYLPDPRTGWDTHIVTLEGVGVLGFTNGPVA